MKPYFLIVLLFLQSACYAQKPFDNGYRGGYIDGLKKKPGTLEFLVVGDWGRNGDYYQKDVSATMARAAVTMGIDFIVSTGDNFYPEGVMSVQDPLWKSSFEDIYTAHSLHRIWYPVLGNHDYGGNPQAEIDYSKISRRWQMPARYHSMEKYADDGTKVLMVFTDTSPFEKSNHQGKNEPFVSNIRAQDTAAQRKWLQEVLRASDARWKFVIGHHPLYTSGPRKGRKNDVAEALQPILESAGVDIYFAGHEHILEHDVLTPRLHHVISGSGSEVTPSTGNPLTKFVASQGGFVTCSVNKEEVWLQYINHEGKLIYSTSVKK